jgi:hypothetical protein
MNRLSLLTLVLLLLSFGITSGCDDACADAFTITLPGQGERVVSTKCAPSHIHGMYNLAPESVSGNERSWLRLDADGTGEFETYSTNDFTGEVTDSIRSQGTITHWGLLLDDDGAVWTFDLSSEWETPGATAFVILIEATSSPSAISDSNPVAWDLECSGEGYCRMAYWWKDDE